MYFKSYLSAFCAYSGDWQPIKEVLQTTTSEQVEALVVMDVLQSLREVWESEQRRRVVSFRNPMEVWEENPTFLLCEIVGVFWALLTLRHGTLLWLLGGQVVKALDCRPRGPSPTIATGIYFHLGVYSALPKNSE